MVSQLWDNAQFLNLENYLLYLYFIISQFRDFIRWMFFKFLLRDNENTLYNKKKIKIYILFK